MESLKQMESSKYVAIVDREKGVRIGGMQQPSKNKSVEILRDFEEKLNRMS